MTLLRQLHRKLSVWLEEFEQGILSEGRWMMNIFFLLEVVGLLLLISY